MHGIRVVQEDLNLKSAEDDIANDHAIILHHTDERTFSETIRLTFGLKQIAVAGQASPSAVTATSPEASSFIFRGRVLVTRGVSAISPTREEGGQPQHRSNSLIQFDSNFSQFTNNR